MNFIMLHILLQQQYGTHECSRYIEFDLGKRLYVGINKINSKQNFANLKVTTFTDDTEKMCAKGKCLK